MSGAEGCAGCGGGEPVDNSDRIVLALRNTKRTVLGTTYQLEKGKELQMPYRHYVLLVLFVKELRRCPKESS